LVDPNLILYSDALTKDKYVMLQSKLIAKQVQIIFYERNLDDLSVGNYRILQAKLNAMGKNI